MGEDFVRCYIGDISLYTLRRVQQQSGILDEWELTDGSEFTYKESYGYRSGILRRDELLLEALAKRAVIAETRHPERVRTSFIWSNALIIADVLTLLSLARARYYPTLAVERNLGKHYSIGWGLIARQLSGNWDIVPLNSLGKFIYDTMTFIEQNPNWLWETGFIPSIYWYTQAQVSYLTAPSVLEMALYWVSMEILASSYVDSQGIRIDYKKDRVKYFIKDRCYDGNDWLFLDEVIDDWYDTRNALFHEGKQELPVAVLTTRRQQVRDFTSLVLIDVLQMQDPSRRKEIARRIKSY